MSSWLAGIVGMFVGSALGILMISLVSWSDPAPLDIVQVLRQNGCDIGEVEP